MLWSTTYLQAVSHQQYLLHVAGQLQEAAIKRFNDFANYFRGSVDWQNSNGAARL